MKRRVAVAAAAMLVMAQPAGAVGQSRFPGENELVRGRWHEDRGDLGTARSIYEGIILRRLSERAARAAGDRLVGIARRSGDVGLEMRWLEALAAAGEANRFAELASRARETGVLPPAFRQMATGYEAAALEYPSAGLAIFLAERAEAGELAATGVINPGALFWWRLALSRGSIGAVEPAAAALAREGRTGEAAALIVAHDPLRLADRIDRLARDLALGRAGAAAERAGAAALLDYLPAPVAAETAAKLTREAGAAGDIDGALFWLARSGPGATGAGLLARLHGAARGEAAKARILGELEARAAAGDTEAAAAAARIRLEAGGAPDADTVGFLLVAASAGEAGAADRLVGLVGRLAPGAPGTAAALAVVERAAGEGDAVAMTVLARLAATGGPVVVDADASRRWYRLAAEAGSAEAQYRTGLSMSLDPAADPAASRGWLARAAGQGYAPAVAAIAGLDASDPAGQASP